MQSYLNFMDNLPKGVKIVFSLFILDLFWVVYKLFLSIKNKSVFQILLSILCFVLGPVLIWPLDFISVISNNSPFWFK